MLIPDLFSATQWMLLLAATFMLLLSFRGQFNKNSTEAICFLTVSALFFYAFAALLDPFLHIWDERFHALVAKNLMGHPMLPTLYDQPVVQIAYDRWDRAVVWLHKQPLFLWQIAASYKVWGVNEFGLRFPSVIMSSLLLPIAYRIGKLLVNKDVGYFSALFLLSSFYTIQLVSGVQGMEHNDLAFLFYVSASIWAWVEYEFSSAHLKWRWAVLIGVFSGAAILCKWLVGLLVYAAFSFQLLSDLTVKRISHIALAILVTAVLVLPWQLLSFAWYPAEAAFELEYNTLHFTEAIEGHGGEFFFHWDKIPVLFGSMVQWLVVPALLGLALVSRKRSVGFAFAALPVIVYLFYSLATTKMQSYPYVAAMPMYLSMAFVIDWMLRQTRNTNMPRFIAWITPVLLIGLMLLNLNAKELLQVHTSWYGYNEYHEELSKNRVLFTNLKEKVPSNSVLFNVSGRHYVEAMFYTDLPAYEMMPGAEEIKQVIDAKMIPVVLDDGRVPIPIEFLADERIIIFKERIHSYH